MPDVISIGSHTYALTLNLLLTGFIGLAFSVALFYWQRKVKREDAVKRELIEAREKADASRHEKVVDLIEDRHGLVINKIEDYCKKNDLFHREFKRDFDNHYHDEENSVVIKRGGM